MSGGVARPRLLLLVVVAAAALAADADTNTTSELDFDETEPPTSEETTPSTASTPSSTTPKPPQLLLTRRLSNETLEAGKILTLRCDVSYSAHPRPKFQWSKNGSPLKNGNGVEIRRNTTNFVTYSILKIKSVAVHDQGFYKCKAVAGRQTVSSTGVILIEEREAPLEPHFISNGPKNDTPIFVEPTPIPALCQPYVGIACDKFLQNQSVYIPYPSTQALQEQKLVRAFSVISFSNEISTSCQRYAKPSLCFSTFPICQTPEVTNANFLQYLEKLETSKNNYARKSLDTLDENSSPKIYFENIPPRGLPSHFNPSVSPSFESNVTPELELTDSLHHNKIKKKLESEIELFIDSKTKAIKTEFHPRYTRQLNKLDDFRISRSDIPLRRVCREDCEILENELCQKEYAIAKRHPEIGQQLTLEECINLPLEAPDCLEIGIERFVGSGDTCYWETGSHYRGVINVASSGLPCMKWGHQFIYKIPANPELAGGHNYCRNPGGTEVQPWCYVEKDSQINKQYCDVPKCSKKIWIYIISIIAGAVIIFTLCIIYICLRHQNSKNNTAAIRNINLPNADKNIYGNSRLNSPIELTDLLNGQNSLGNSSGSRTNRILRVPHYSLSQIKFVEELGEGAFGKVYKGELNRGSDTIFVAVKALKENASPKTQSDFRREIELISELRHENIVCILGVVLREEPLCMLFEFMAKGDLHEFLVSKAPPQGTGLTSPQFLSIAHHIAAGMEYLAAHHYVHRDLAARNCLVADNLIVKISDFGLSRDIYSSDYYRVRYHPLNRGLYMIFRR